MSSKLSNSDYYEYLHNNLRELVNNGRIGRYFLTFVYKLIIPVFFFNIIGVSKFQPVDIQSKPNRFLEVTRGFKNYHFCIDIPYAGRKLNWEMIFDPEDFSELPDFDFNDYSFLPEPDINYIAENVPSWDNWDLTNSQSMLNILNEFLCLYKKTQVYF